MNANKILEMIRKQITRPSFSREPHSFALSVSDIRKLCQERGIDLTESQLYHLLTETLSEHLWTEICAAKLYVTGVKYIDNPDKTDSKT